MEINCSQKQIIKLLFEKIVVPLVAKLESAGLLNNSAFCLARSIIQILNRSFNFEISEIEIFKKRVLLYTIHVIFSFMLF